MIWQYGCGVAVQEGWCTHSLVAGSRRWGGESGAFCGSEECETLWKRSLVSSLLRHARVVLLLVIIQIDAAFEVVCYSSVAFRTGCSLTARLQ